MKKNLFPEVPEMAYVTSRDLERLFNIRAATLRLWVATGIFPQPIRPGKRSMYWKYSEVAAWFNEQNVRNRVQPSHPDPSIVQIEGAVA